MEKEETYKISPWLPVDMEGAYKISLWLPVELLLLSLSAADAAVVVHLTPVLCGIVSVVRRFQEIPVVGGGALGRGGGGARRPIARGGGRRGAEG